LVTRLLPILAAVAALFLAQTVAAEPPGPEVLEAKLAALQKRWEALGGVSYEREISQQTFRADPATSVSARWKDKEVQFEKARVRAQYPYHSIDDLLSPGVGMVLGPWGVIASSGGGRRWAFYEMEAGWQPPEILPGGCKIMSYGAVAFGYITLSDPSAWRYYRISEACALDDAGNRWIFRLEPLSGSNIFETVDFFVTFSAESGLVEHLAMRGDSGSSLSEVRIASLWHEGVGEYLPMEIQSLLRYRPSDSPLSHSAFEHRAAFRRLSVHHNDPPEAYGWDALGVHADSEASLEFDYYKLGEQLPVPGALVNGVAAPRRPPLRELPAHVWREVRADPSRLLTNPWAVCAWSLPLGLIFLAVWLRGLPRASRAAQTRLPLLLAALTLLATAPRAEPPGPEVLEAKLAALQKRWEALGGVSYEFELSELTFRADPATSFSAHWMVGQAQFAKATVRAQYPYHSIEEMTVPGVGMVLGPSAVISRTTDPSGAEKWESYEWDDGWQGPQILPGGRQPLWHGAVAFGFNPSFGPTTWLHFRVSEACALDDEGNHWIYRLESLSRSGAFATIFATTDFVVTFSAESGLVERWAMRSDRGSIMRDVRIASLWHEGVGEYLPVEVVSLSQYHPTDPRSSHHAFEQHESFINWSVHHNDPSEAYGWGALGVHADNQAPLDFDYYKLAELLPVPGVLVNGVAAPRRPPLRELPAHVWREVRADPMRLFTNPWAVCAWSLPLGLIFLAVWLRGLPPTSRAARTRLPLLLAAITLLATAPRAEPPGPEVLEAKLAALYRRWKALGGISFRQQYLRIDRTTPPPSTRPLGAHAATVAIKARAAGVAPLRVQEDVRDFRGNWPWFAERKSGGTWRYVVVLGPGGVYTAPGTRNRYAYHDYDLFEDSAPREVPRYGSLPAEPDIPFGLEYFRDPIGDRIWRPVDACCLDESGDFWRFRMETTKGRNIRSSFVYTVHFSPESGLIDRMTISSRNREILAEYMIQSLWHEGIGEYLPVLWQGFDSLPQGAPLGTSTGIIQRYQEKVFSDWECHLVDAPEAYGWPALGVDIARLEGRRIDFYPRGQESPTPGVILNGRAVEATPPLDELPARLWREVRADPIRLFSNPWVVCAWALPLGLILAFVLLSGPRRASRAARTRLPMLLAALTLLTTAPRAEPPGPEVLEAKLAALYERWKALGGVSYELKLSEQTFRADPATSFSARWKEARLRFAKAAVRAQYPYYSIEEMTVPGVGMALGPSGVISRITDSSGGEKWDFYEMEAGWQPPQEPLGGRPPLWHGVEAFGCAPFFGPTLWRYYRISEACALDDALNSWIYRVESLSGSNTFASVSFVVIFSAESGLVESLVMRGDRGSTLRDLRIASQWHEGVGEYLPVEVVSLLQLGPSDAPSPNYAFERHESFINWSVHHNDPPEAYGWGALGVHADNQAPLDFDLYKLGEQLPVPGVLVNGVAGPRRPPLRKLPARLWREVQTDPIRLISNPWVVCAWALPLGLILAVVLLSGPRRVSRAARTRLPLLLAALVLLTTAPRAEPPGPEVLEAKLAALKARFWALRGVSYTQTLSNIGFNHHFDPTISRLVATRGSSSGRVRQVRRQWPWFYCSTPGVLSIAAGPEWILERQEGGYPPGKFEYGVFEFDESKLASWHAVVKDSFPLPAGIAFGFLDACELSGSGQIRLENACALDDSGLRWRFGMQLLRLDGRPSGPTLDCVLQFSPTSGMVESLEKFGGPYEDVESIVAVAVWHEELREYLPLIISTSKLNIASSRSSKTVRGSDLLYAQQELSCVHFDDWSIGHDDAPEAYGWPAFGVDIADLEGTRVDFYRGIRVKAIPGVIWNGRAVEATPPLKELPAHLWREVRADPIRLISNPWVVCAWALPLGVIFLAAWLRGLRRDARAAKDRPA